MNELTLKRQQFLGNYAKNQLSFLCVFALKYKIFVIKCGVKLEVIYMLVLFFLLWVIFNGSLTLEICIFGILISVALFAFSCKFMDFSPKKEILMYKKGLLFVRYAILLVKEVVKANISVIRMILSQREEIEPTLATFHTDLKTSTGRAFLANAITLTPGTITVSLEKDQYTVHCLDRSLADGMNDSEIVEYIKKFEK